MCNCEDEVTGQPATKKQAAGNYSSPAAEDIGETKIYMSNKGSRS
jgi:hypothetical protein